MSGVTEAQVQTQMRLAVDILEDFRAHADTQAGTSGQLRTLEEAIIGEFTSRLTDATRSFRDGMSALQGTDTIRSFLDPILKEYAAIISADATDSFGGAYEDVDDILDALYEFLHNNSATIESRQISFNATAISQTKGSTTGKGALRRLTVDENGYDLEACTVEKKHFRCRQDGNTGADPEAEVFEVLGQQDTKDNLNRGNAAFGSGLDLDNREIVSRHAGEGTDGGSLLSNGSFSDYNANNTNRFEGWAPTLTNAVAGDVTQNTTTYYRDYPGSQTSASAQLAGDNANENIVLTQTLEDMSASELRRDRPYFLRAMIYSPTTGGATDGTFKLRLGVQEATQAISGLTQDQWTEVIIPLDQNCWYDNFKEDTLAVDIEIDAVSTGFLLVDDVILCELDLIDGTYWVLTQNRGGGVTPVRWVVDDEITLKDTWTVGNGKIQSFIYWGYGRYLPSAASPTISDP